MLKTVRSTVNVSQITGVLPVVNGGTGVTTSTGTGNTVLSAAPTLSGDVTLSTGNLIQGTAAKGINFTANTPKAGATSQLLSWYEEGTWTPTFSNLTVVLGAGSVAYTGRYTRIGRVVQCSWQIAPTGGATTASTANLTTITNLPFSITSSGAFPYPVSDNSVSNIGPGVFYSGTLAYTPTWSARTGVMVGSGTFIV